MRTFGKSVLGTACGFSRIGYGCALVGVGCAAIAGLGVFIILGVSPICESPPSAGGLSFFLQAQKSRVKDKISEVSKIIFFIAFSFLFKILDALIGAGAPKNALSDPLTISL